MSVTNAFSTKGKLMTWTVLEPGYKIKLDICNVCLIIHLFFVLQVICFILLPAIFIIIIQGYFH